MVDYPSIIKVGPGQYDNNIENYYQIFNENTYYIAENEDIKDTKAKSIDDLFSEVPYVYDEYDAEIKDLIQRYNNKYGQNINKNNQKFFETELEFRETIKKMISDLKENSIIKELPMPNVDIDLVYANFDKTLAAEFINKTSGKTIDKDTVYRGGDGTIPSWSSLLTGLKWIFESKLSAKEREKIPNIKLIEYCSRLADSKLNLPNFKAISCRCIENNVYKDNLDDCSHQFMLGDKANLFEYIAEELSKDEENIENKKKAIEYYPSIGDDENYLKICNLNLYKLSNKEVSKKCIDEMAITEYDFKRKHCGLEGYKSMPNKACCSVHIQGINENSEKFDNYYCANIKNSKDEIEAFKTETKARKEFYDEIEISVEVDCHKIDSFSLIYRLSFKMLVILLIILD